MKKLSLLGLTVLVAVLLPAAAAPASTAAIHEPATTAASIDPLIYEQLAASPDGRAGFFVRFRPQADLAPAFHMADWDLRGRFVYEVLRDTAERSQPRVRAWLEARGTDYKPLIINNSLFVQADASVLRELAAFPEVASLRGNHTYRLPEMQAGSQPAEAQPEGIAWGVSHIGADQVWNDFGIKGQGIVVAEMTTGVEYTHAALLPNYKCAGLITHTACWEDPSNICPGDTPCDNVGQGTFMTGVMVGDDDPGLTWNAGVAPDAQWIACKGCEGPGCSEFALTSCADWFMAPGGDPANRPHVINGAWGGQGCDDWFMPYIMAWHAAGMFPLFSPGTGADCYTIGSPADYSNTMATGATDANDQHSVSAMGPSCYGGIKPEVSAPGANICSAVPGNGWDCWYTAAGANSHTAGLAALLYEAAPDLIGDFIGTRQAITSTAVCIEDLLCGGQPCPGGNNIYGWGRIDAYAAISAALSACSPVTQTDFVWIPLTPTVGQAITFQASASGTLPITYTWNLGDGTTAQGQVISHSYALSGSYVVVVTATNCGTGTASAAHTLTVTPCDPLTAVDLGWHPLTPTLGQATTFTASASGTLPITYTWNLGDGTMAIGEIVSHSYGQPGTYTVVLTASNCGGAGLATATHTLTITPPACQPVTATAFDWQPLTPTVGQMATFTAGASGAPPISYTWDLGDGTMAIGEIVSHSYGQPGTYTVVLTASNCGGAGLATATHALTITPPACRPVTATAFDWQPLTPTVGQMATFTASASGAPPISYTWDLGDGTTAQGQVVDHAYTQPGTYTVVLTATNACGRETVYHNLVVSTRSWRIYLPLVLRQ